jgi:hypothetical protein
LAESLHQLRGGLDDNLKGKISLLSGLISRFGPEIAMNTGDVVRPDYGLFALEDLYRIVARHGGDKGVWSLTCAEQFRAMAFAQLTYRESLRDIEACLRAQAAKLYHMGFREPVARSTLANANESRDWRIWESFAGRLIIQARELYLGEDLGLDLSNTVYALDSTTIDLCLSVFPWAHFRTTKAAVKMHTLLDLKGSIPSFIYISDGKLHDVHALDLLEKEPGSTVCAVRSSDGRVDGEWAATPVRT